MKKLWSWTWRIVGALLLLLLLYQLWIFAHIAWWVQHNPATSAFMDQRLLMMQNKHPDAELRHQWVPYAKISNNLKRAMIASEDAKFVDHEGFDWDGIQKAYEKNMIKGAGRCTEAGAAALALWGAESCVSSGIKSVSSD